MKIPTYRAETQRGSGLATQLSNIQTTPDLFGGNLAKQVAETGNALAQWGLRKAEMAAESSSANAIRAFKSSAEEIQDNLFKTEGYDPLLGEEEYKRQIKDLIGVSGAELPNKRSRQLFQSAISDVADGYRRNFEKINNAKIIDKFKVDTEEEILSAKKIISNPKLSTELRLEQFKRIEQILNSNALRANLPATNIKKYKDAFYKSTFESTLLTRVRTGNDRDELLTDLEDGILDSNTPENQVLAELLNGVAPEDRIEIFDKAKDIAKQIDDEKLANEEKIEKKNKTIIDEAEAQLYSLPPGSDPAVVKKAYENLRKVGGLDTGNKRKQADNFAHNMGVPGMVKAGENQVSPYPKFDDETSVDILREAYNNRTLTMEIFNHNKAGLTASTRERYFNLIRTSKTEGTKFAFELAEDLFRVEDYKSQAGIDEPEPMKQMYSNFNLQLKDWMQENPGFSYNSIVKEANRLLSEYAKEKLSLIPQLQEEYIELREKKLNMLDETGDLKKLIMDAKPEDRFNILEKFIKDNPDKGINRSTIIFLKGLSFYNEELKRLPNLSARFGKK